jgi:hypothetical protein
LPQNLDKIFRFYRRKWTEFSSTIASATIKDVTITKQIRYPKVYQGSGRPSPERSFRRVRQTTLTLNYQRQETEISPLNCLQQQILKLMNIPESIYTLPVLVPE